jgi:hypothetical protein
MRVAVFADCDEGGAGLAAARAATLRWRAEGRAVRVLLPDAPGDANDILRRRAHE